MNATDSDDDDYDEQQRQGKKKTSCKDFFHTFIETSE